MFSIGNIVGMWSWSKNQADILPAGNSFVVAPDRLTEPNTGVVNRMHQHHRRIPVFNVTIRRDKSCLILKTFYPSIILHDIFRYCIALKRIAFKIRHAAMGCNCLYLSFADISSSHQQSCKATIRCAVNPDSICINHITIFIECELHTFYNIFNINLSRIAIDGRCPLVANTNDSSS